MAHLRATSLTRRQFLSGVAASAGTAILAACGGGSTATDTPKPAATTSGAAPTGVASAPTTSAANLGQVILIAASLGLLGLGAQPPTPEWGLMVADARKYLTQAPWFATFPGLTILLTVIAFNVFGDGLRDTLDPRLRN